MDEKISRKDAAHEGISESGQKGKYVKPELKKLMAIGQTAGDPSDIAGASHGSGPIYNDGAS